MLVIAPADDQHQNIHWFRGKLVVMLASKDQHPVNGAAIAVGSTTGTVTHDGQAGQRIFFTDPAGDPVVVQVPAELNWSDGDIAVFAAGVSVNANAQQGVG